MHKPIESDFLLRIFVKENEEFFENVYSRRHNLQITSPIISILQEKNPQPPPQMPPYPPPNFRPSPPEYSFPPPPNKIPPPYTPTSIQKYGPPPYIPSHPHYNPPPYPMQSIFQNQAFVYNQLKGPLVLEPPPGNNQILYSQNYTTQIHNQNNYVNNRPVMNHDQKLISQNYHQQQQYGNTIPHYSNTNNISQQLPMNINSFSPNQLQYVNLSNQNMNKNSNFNLNMQNFPTVKLNGSLENLQIQDNLLYSHRNFSQYGSQKTSIDKSTEEVKNDNYLMDQNVIEMENHKINSSKSDFKLKEDVHNDKDKDDIKTTNLTEIKKLFERPNQNKKTTNSKEIKEIKPQNKNDNPELDKFHDKMLSLGVVNSQLKDDSNDNRKTDEEAKAKQEFNHVKSENTIKEIQSTLPHPDVDIKQLLNICLKMRDPRLIKISEAAAKQSHYNPQI